MSDNPSPYVDTGWTSDPATLTLALAGFGFAVQPDNTITQTDPTLAGPISALTGYQVLDDQAYVLVRSLVSITPPAGISIAGPQLTRALTGVFMPDTSVAGLSLSALDLTFAGDPMQSLNT
jgi:hypothetical protein